ncbi:MAG: endonuclease [Bacteroidales bacterium]|nr:endonuclease [Bacteroidales bacterium]
MIGLRAIPIFFFTLYISASSIAQPAGYYDSASGLTGTELQQALHNIIDGHTVLTYTPGVWDAVKTTDKRPDGTVWDMYSDNPAGVDPYPAGVNPYNYTFVTDQCGNYNSEADCYNREHSFPKSWFNDGYPMYTDLNHVFPTDGWVNNKRGNYAFGETNNPSWTSLNGSKVGSSSVSGFTGTVFEPIDDYKGDFARAHLYMAVRYYGEDSSWDITDMTNKSQPKEWALDMLLRWHNDDPVSDKETDRNDEVYVHQGNRNPFIDEASYAEKIWGSGTAIYDINQNLSSIIIYPNPVVSELVFELGSEKGKSLIVNIYTLTGSLLRSEQIINNSRNTINTSSLRKGSYILVIESDNAIFRERFIKL